jgi:hypothetical protein
MRNILFLFFLSVSVLFSCSSSPNELSPKDQFDELENIFSIANWKTIDGADTSYLYFSRLGDLNYKVYDFKIVKGDSSLREVSEINYVNKDVNWILSAGTLKLVSSDSTSAIWNTVEGNKMAYSFKRLSDSSIFVKLPGNRQAVMMKTLPLATFLVRSKYDYISNTHTVDSPIVKHRGKDL